MIITAKRLNMEALSIEGTAKTPSVKFDGHDGVIEIKGRSIPENSIEFYKPLVEWLEEYNSIRPHASLGNKTPYEFSANLESVYL